MRKQPDLSNAKIKNCLFNHYGLQAVEAAFLPRGGDINSAVFHVITRDGTPYFLKLRRGVLNEITLLLPKLLNDSGIQEVIAPSKTFYEGYGPSEINPVALAYYRFERIVQDIAEWGERAVLTEQGGQDRARWLQGLKRWFQPTASKPMPTPFPK